MTKKTKTKSKKKAKAKTKPRVKKVVAVEVIDPEPVAPVEISEPAESDGRRITRLMLAVYQVLEKSGARGLTDSEVSRALVAAGHPEAPDSTYRKRRTELTQLGHVRWNGARRRNPKGAMEKVWVVSDLPLPTEEGAPF